ncbi:hypothetical protein CcaverHIS002_0508960 [Cutaneotrichosporon cavernicola]|uniref:Uncharacterized protein n=1 Tax=Cutaneotrichosporon cavernicola TaxID=279322 RepID=A0AA48L7C7_9TREE|nr:uncharacterized protein CcaverHIS019_0509520 [Cutaneotrichosporon cavernicola]BEI85495.1 hypothetical protein CcaverHIS002_0508960 [Cutaneotrichosporon cavernicola]BEI93324.1 hypothetical protein CcaverHIS019_0509520 [Cutaneotrichosporon cavernicola]
MDGTKREFEKTYENEVGRDAYKARYDFETIRQIIAEAHFVNVAFVDLDGNPQCIPMVAAIVETPAGLEVYLHGYHRARLVRLVPPETRVCITATLMDGIVLALSAFNSSINHRSAVLHGQVGEWSEGEAGEKERWEASRAIVEGVMPGRWDGCRAPSPAEMTTTGFVKVKIHSASAKIRSGEPGEERRDEKDEELRSRVWAGVIPVRAAYGTPEPSRFNRVPLPDYIQTSIVRGGALSN